jgi:protein-tyrosine phosphatase
MSYLATRQRLESNMTGRELQGALWAEPPSVRMMPGVPRKMDNAARMRIRKDCDEVFPGIIVGNSDTAKNLDYLLDLGVTHVLNTAEQDVKIDPRKYTKQGISYKGFAVKDLPNTDITQYFDESSDFIERALSLRCGLVFVACYMGYSRCSALVTAYLMKKKNYSATQALMYMRQFREVQPNLGFLHQLAGYDNDLRKERYRKYNFLTTDIKYSI